MSRIQNRFQIQYFAILWIVQQPTVNIGLVHLSQFCFHMLYFVNKGGGGFKMFNFQVVCAKNFNLKMNFFFTASKYGMA